MSTEEWRPIVQNPKFGFVSSLGNVKSVDGAVRKQFLSRNGYMRIGFAGGRHTIAVHRLVTAAFIGKCPDGLVVNHKNANKQDNRVENLEYVTQSRNAKHSYDIGVRGIDLRNRKLTNEQYAELYKRRLLGETLKSLCVGTPVTIGALSMKFKRIRENGGVSCLQ